MITAATHAIETHGVGKSFGVSALKAIDLQIRRGAVFRLLGPNGAGKTTTVRILTTLLRPHGGTALVLGHDVVEERARGARKVATTI